MKHRLQEDTASDYLREAKHFYEYYDFIEDEHVRSSLTKLPVRSKIFIGVGLDRKIDFAVWNALLESDCPNEIHCSTIFWTGGPHTIGRRRRRAYHTFGRSGRT